MTPKQISYNQLRKAIEVSFNNDNFIFDFYDPNSKVENLTEIVDDILNKINTYEKPFYFGIYDKEKLIGYFVYKESQLISFALAKEYRVRKYLREFFKIIKNQIKGHFSCVLWAKNTRAIKYLLKHKMEVIKQNDELILLAI